MRSSNLDVGYNIAIGAVVLVVMLNVGELLSRLILAVF